MRKSFTSHAFFSFPFPILAKSPSLPPHFTIQRGSVCSISGHRIGLMFFIPFFCLLCGITVPLHSSVCVEIAIPSLGFGHGTSFVLLEIEDPFIFSFLSVAFHFPETKKLFFSLSNAILS